MHLLLFFAGKMLIFVERTSPFPTSVYTVLYFRSATQP